MLRTSLTITLSAALVFALQPMMGKVLLPWFGGGPSIWSACLLFFQILLLAGYAYAHGLSTWLSPRAGARLHVFLLSLACLLGIFLGMHWSSPITPSTAFRPEDSAWPALRILLALTASVGLPFFLLSATSPLLQTWFHLSHPERSPYRLYALSNLGSLGALVAYPFLLEPSLGLHEQALLWSVGFLIFAGGMGVCAWPFLRRKLAATAQVVEKPSDPAPGKALRLLWFGLAATGSILLLATTNQICLNVAVVPFLWVLPLALYLLSHILCFHDPRLAARGFWLPIFALSSLMVLALLFHGGEKIWQVGSVRFELGLAWQVLIYGTSLLSGCMLVHGELVRLKPPASRLTSFYLWMSAGGAAGGLFVSLIAPMVFDGLWEFHLGLAAVAAFCLLTSWQDKESPLNGQWALTARAAALSALAGLMLILGLHPLHFMREAVFAERNFYGVLRVLKKHEGLPKYFSHDLYDGQILHGYQLQDPKLKSIPTSYFSDQSGLGLLLAKHPARPAPLRVALIGLGVGTAAALAKPKDLFRFYEINPAVIRLAEGQDGYFSFLKDSKAEIQIVEGDARVQLEREREAGLKNRFDLLVVDAFQSDAIPAHLLTKEAISLYLSQLKDDGALMMHVTNLHLDLEPVVDRLASELNLSVAVIRHPGDGWLSLMSRWMLLTRNKDILATEAIAARSELPHKLPRHAPLWTDDHSSLLPILQ
ncbi:MAG: fused MFS/spermidine synthase [Deltaproteobacteria bacterium]|nr:fused MFS/spermidine synthase [Deltaproteobacteria bacterium]